MQIGFGPVEGNLRQPALRSTTMSTIKRLNSDEERTYPKRLPQCQQEVIESCHQTSKSSAAYNSSAHCFALLAASPDSIVDLRQGKTSRRCYLGDSNISAIIHTIRPGPHRNAVSKILGLFHSTPITETQLPRYKTSF